MRIFALETDVEKIKQRFCDANERVLLITPYHTLSFFFASLREVVVTLILVGVGVGGWWLGAPVLFVVAGLVIAWLVFVFFNLLKAYLDWLYDRIIITEDKIILLDQTSIFKQEVKPIYVDNIGGITTATQFWNIFPFGTVIIHLKEGLGGDDLTLRYVPKATEVATMISQIVTQYQRQQGERSKMNSD